MVSTTTASWPDALEDCRRINATLATSVKSFVESLLSSEDGSNEKDGWELDEGMQWATFDKWASGQPGWKEGWTFRLNCAIHKNGRWHDIFDIDDWIDYNCPVQKYVCQCGGIFLTNDVA